MGAQAAGYKPPCMEQLFPPSANSIFRVALGLGVAFAVAFPFVAYGFYRSPAITKEGTPIQQPVPFSHKHHVSDDGIDCRYCHETVETSAFAGMPTTTVCMGCHSQLWSRARVLAPVRDSLQSGQPIVWNRVNNLPDFVYFKHDIHVNKGIGCTTCHGDVRNMGLMAKGAPLTMQWCLHCHREPERYVRPRSEVFNPAWTFPANQDEIGPQLVREYNIEKSHLQNCYTCHR